MTAKFLSWCTGRSVFAVVVFCVTSVFPALAQETVEIVETVETVEIDEASDTDTGDDSAVKTDSGRISVPLSGRGLVVRSGNLSVTPNTLEMDLVEIGDSSTATLTLTHDGDLDSPAVEIQDAELFGQNADEFDVDFAGFQTLFPGESIDISITLTPLTEGQKAAGMRLNIVDATVPYVLVFSGQARFPLTSDLIADDLTIGFGQVLQDDTANVDMVLISQGESDAPAINISAISLSGTNADEFTIDFQSTTLPPGELLEINVSVDTSVTGFKSATAEVFHDGRNGAIEIELQATVTEPQAIPVNFSASTLDAPLSIDNPTSLQFGPDGKLYVAEKDGYIHVFDVTRNGVDDYSAELDTTIDLIVNVQNHNDDGTPNNTKQRLVTGIHVAGTAANPVIYTASSDWRMAAGPSGRDSGLDTNSGILHKLAKNGDTWSMQDLVRGLPRSEENHIPNGLLLLDNKIYINIGGNTNEGLPSNNFANLPEYALSAAVLEIDLGMIGDTTYDIPTLDGPADQFDPFGGHNGLNQAMLVEDGPIELYATGFRNAYDIVYTEAGRFYIWDNGSNTGWGGQPDDSCLNVISDEGSKFFDGLHLVPRGYYAGHPNPTRGNKANTFGGQSPIEGSASPDECEFISPNDNGALTLKNSSTNGLTEYTASNFGGAMKNDLVAVSMNGDVTRVVLNDAGNNVTSVSKLADDLGSAPLDVTAQGNADIYPGTIWVADLFGNDIYVLEPSDY